MNANTYGIVEVHCVRSSTPSYFQEVVPNDGIDVVEFIELAFLKSQYLVVVSGLMLPILLQERRELLNFLLRNVYRAWIIEWVLRAPPVRVKYLYPH